MPAAKKEKKQKNQTKEIKESWLDRNWPFRHTRISLNSNTGLIKIVAMLTMLTDHLGAAVFPRYRILRIIGRIAFPLYAYCVAAGCVYTRSIGRYLKRMAIMALIAQPLYVLALHHTNGAMYVYRFAEHPFRAALSFYVYSWKDPSIMLTLIIGVAVIWALRERHLSVMILLLILTHLYDSFVDYGLKGVVLILVMYLFIDRWYLEIPAMAGYMLWWGLQGSAYTLFGVRFGIQMFAALALPLILIPLRKNLRIKNWVYYAFYPAHLAVILLIENWDGLLALVR